MESTLDTRIDMHFYRIGKVNCDSICFKDTIMPRKASSRARAYLMDGGGDQPLIYIALNPWKSMKILIYQEILLHTLTYDTYDPLSEVPSHMTVVTILSGCGIRTQGSK